MTCAPFLRTLHRRLARLALIVGVAALGLAGCGGSGGATADTTTGEVIVGLTDAPGDFLTYTVDVESLTLTKANGTVVETLPLRTRVDFAQYIELTEFFTAATIPSGIYVSATLRLNYSAADVQVEDANGAAAAATVQDSAGQPVTTLDLTVRFDNARRLVIAPGVPAHLTLDFNLAASNQVDLTGVTPVVTVEPLLVADINPVAPKPHRVRGPLADVNLGASSFKIAIRPFHLLTGGFGGLTVATDSDTSFEIDGTHYQGAAGLAQLALKPTATATVAIGDLDVSRHRFVAREVYAGSSVAYGTSDVVTGHVIARSGDTLTVRGATLVRAGGTFSFRDTVTVSLSATTKVAQQAGPNAGLNKDSLSVGQHITALGKLDSAATPNLDARNGLVRMLITSVNGHVNTVAPGNIEMNVQSINGRPIGLFDFTGTGSNPAQYRVATGSLSLAGIVPGTSARVRGMVVPFGQAGAGGDFSARSVIDVSQAPALLAVDWTPPTALPFTSSSANGVVVNLNGVGLLHHVFRPGVVTALVNPPAIEPRDALRGLYAIGDHGTVQVYTDFDLYQQAITARLADGRAARLTAAYGNYADPTAILAADRMFTALR